MPNAFFSFGPFTVSAFSIFVAFSILVSADVCIRSALMHRIKANHALVLVDTAIVFGMLFGHLLYGLSVLCVERTAYTGTIIDIISPHKGGFMLIGVFAGIILAVNLTSAFTKEGKTGLYKSIVPAMLLLIFMVRLAEPLCGQGKGPSVDAAITNPFLGYAPEADYPDDKYFPAYLYEALYALVLLIMNLRTTSIAKPHNNPVVYLILYLTGQSFFEILRQDAYINYTSLATFIRLNQLYAVIILAGILVVDTLRARNKLNIRNLLIFCCAVLLNIGAQFLFDKPLNLFGRMIYFDNLLVYIILAISSACIGYSVLSTHLTVLSHEYHGGDTHDSNLAKSSC